MENSFPATERRTPEHAERLFRECDYYKVIGTKDNDDKVTSFLAYWLLNDFCFIDHLAVDESLRNKGMGGALVTHFLQNTTLPIILEVEPPTDNTSQRRIAFYQRLGFHLNPYHYEQPSMQPGQPAIPLYIMSYPEPLTENTFEGYVKELYRKVYFTLLY